jgi:hypothetical protein
MNWPGASAPGLFSGDVMRRAARTDANQTAIVDEFRAWGASVLPLHAVGSGCPDLLLGHPRETFLVEVKDGSKPPSARKLTPDQVEFHASWRGRIEIVTGLEDVARIMRGVRG